MKSLALLFLALCLAAPLPANTRTTKTTTEEEVAILTAKRWVEAFYRLEPRNNIAIQIVAEDQLFEFTHVNQIEAIGRMLMIRYRGVGDRDFHASIDAETVFFLREGNPKDRDG